jgi:AcrR family transcriptional regulator
VNTPLSPSPTAELNEKARTVLRAATEVFLSHGFSAATTDMIQREAGVSKATLYACYPNKEALFTAVIEAQCAGMADAMRAVEAAPGDVASTLAAMGRSYMHSVLAPAGLALFRVVAAEALRFPHLGRSFYLAGPKMITNLVARQLSFAAEAGDIDVQSVGIDAAAHILVSLFRGERHMEYLTHPEARPSEAQIEQWAQAAVEVFLRAFGIPR